MLIVYYRIEELVTLHYGNFSILGEQAREFAQRTNCSNQGLFLLEHMLHNVATMQRKEH